MIFSRSSKRRGHPHPACPTVPLWNTPLRPPELPFLPVFTKTLAQNWGLPAVGSASPSRSGHGAAQPAGQSQIFTFNPTEDAGGGCHSII